MCPAPGMFIDEHRLFGSMEACEGKDKHLIYYHTDSNPHICQNDMSHTDVKPNFAPANEACSYMRFDMSYSIWECNPETNAHCKLATMAHEEETAMR
eukprot:9505341-Ditylum_brightwellii.AAC.2